MWPLGMWFISELGSAGAMVGLDLRVLLQLLRFCCSSVMHEQVLQSSHSTKALRNVTTWPRTPVPVPGDTSPLSVPPPCPRQPRDPTSQCKVLSVQPICMEGPRGNPRKCTVQALIKSL